MENGAFPWLDRQYKITEFSPYLRNGYFIQQPYENVSIGTEIFVTVTGPATIYVSTYGGTWDGGYSTSLPDASWIKGEGQVSTSGPQLYNVFSRILYGASTLALPGTTTNKTVMLIVVVPYCSGK